MLKMSKEQILIIIKNHDEWTRKCDTFKELGNLTINCKENDIMELLVHG